MIVSVKSLLQKLRDDGWEPLLLAATNFCGGRNIIVPNMADNIPARGYPRISRKMVTCFHYYKVEIFNEVLHRNIVEMNNRFSETSTHLLKCTACLDLETHLAALIMRSYLNLPIFTLWISLHMIAMSWLM